MTDPVNQTSRPRVDDWRQVLGRWLLPPRCLVCAEPGDGRDLCAPCHRQLPWNRPACAACALPSTMPAPRCRQCLARPLPFREVHATFRYAFPLDRLLPRFKFHQDLASGRLLAELMAAGLASAARPQAVVPVPLHRDRLRQRGYDQALELARPLARRLELPLIASGLSRIRATRPQTELGSADRRRNLVAAFAGRTDRPWPAHVALVDDVMTTGATLSECARTLLACGVRRVDAWVLARAPPPASRGR